MAFLDNSGDIILDAVLTDHGRKTLSKGDGSFRITKFALGDEEINYSLYNPNHSSGSAYYDIEILQTPVLEAFTNNASSMKTQLVTMANENILYMPILKLNTLDSSTTQHANGGFLVAVDRATEGTSNPVLNQAIGFQGTTRIDGILFGESFGGSSHIRVDQGLDTNEIAPDQVSALSDMVETSYIIQMDSRLGFLIDSNGLTIANDYIDDDQIAFYTVDSSDNIVEDNTNEDVDPSETIQGPRGTTLRFKIGSSLDLRTSSFLFTKLGSTTTMTNNAGDATQLVRFIDSIVRVTGMTTGYSIDIPIRFIKTVVS